MTDIFTKMRKRHEARREEEWDLVDFLDLCKGTKEGRQYYANAPERMLTAIGEPVIVDTRKDDRMSRIFLNRRIKTYPAFSDFYGMEETVEGLVSFFKHAAQGLEEARQILYLLGPVGGGKCLVKGTEISMWDGSYKNIENIQEGDFVISIDENGNKSKRLVTSTFHIEEKKQIIKVKTRRGLVIEGAPTHRIKTEDGWVRLDELTPDLFLSTLREHQFGNEKCDNENLKNTLNDIYWDQIKSVEITDQYESMYDFEVEGFHNYIANGIVSHNSSIAERLKYLMERVPVYALKAYNHEKDKWEVSPCFEHPFGLFDYDEDAPEISKSHNIPLRYFKVIPSPWAVKRLEEVDGDITKFKAVKMFPSVLKQQMVTKVEPGDENNQDISSLVGKVNIRELEDHDQHDPDAYNWMGGLNVAHQGMMEFVEMFKAPLKMLHPLLTSTQEGHYNGTEQFGAIPFQGIIVAHCFSEDTELLTSTGWRGIDNIEEGDEIATLNRESNNIEYQPALEKIVQNYVGDVYHMSSSAADHLVTPNHRMLYESYGSYKEAYAQDFFIKGANISVSGFYEKEDSEIYENDNEIKFHAWCITDGNLYYQRKDGRLNYRFHLKKDRKIDRLISLLDEMGLDRSITNNGETTHIRVNGVNEKYTKELSYIHRQISPRQFNILLEEWSYTDGSRVVHRSEDGFSLSTNVKFHADFIQEMSVLAGHKTTCALCDKDGYDTVYAISVRKNVQKVRCDAINKGNQDYSGRVWCLRVQNETLFARRNGKVMVTLNSNESEWKSFRNNKNNEAFLDRVNIIKVPYCLRVTEEEKIYEKLIANSDLAGCSVAPGTFHMMAQYSALTRLKKPENSNLFSKMEIYDGKNLKSKDPKAKSIDEYREDAGVNEGMDGSSTRFAFKILSKVFNYDPDEIAANPIHLMYILEKQIIQEQLAPEEEERRIAFIRGTLAPKYAEFLGDELQKAYLESYKEYGQNIFDRYIQLADFWVQDKDYRDPDTGEVWDRDLLDEELQKIEKPAGVSNVKDFRSEVVGFVIRHQARHQGRNPDWTGYEQLREVIEKKMFSNTEELLPVISFSKKSTKDEEDKHNDFVQRMRTKGYTEKEVRLAVEWYLRYSRSN